MNLETLQRLIWKQKRCLRAERNIRVRGISVPTPALFDKQTRESPKNARPLRIWKRWFKNYAKIQEIVKQLSRQIQEARSELRIA